MRTIKLLATLIAVFAVLAVPAFAQSPTGDAYGNPLDSGGDPMGQQNDAKGVQLAASLPSTDRVGESGATLPFTGLELAILLATAGGLILLGVRLRRDDEA